MIVYNNFLVGKLPRETKKKLKLHYLSKCWEGSHFSESNFNNNTAEIKFDVASPSVHGLDILCTHSLLGSSQTFWNGGCLGRLKAAAATGPDCFSKELLSGRRSLLSLLPWPRGNLNNIRKPVQRLILSLICVDDYELTIEKGCLRRLKSSRKLGTRFRSRVYQKQDFKT